MNDHPKFRKTLARLEAEFGRDKCWPYPAKPTKNGYCMMNFGKRADGPRKTIMAHRLAYLILRGPLSDELELDHRCRFRRCCNPWHLDQMLHVENVLRGISPAANNARKTHCKNGHPLSGDNLCIHLRRSGRVRRQCIACRREYGKLQHRRTYNKKQPANGEKTHCKRGHPLSGDNLRIYYRGTAENRICRACEEIRRG